MKCSRKPPGFLCLALVLMLQGVAFAQNNFSSEEELKRQADKRFESEDYVAAYPLYTQLVSVYPKDPHYNYRLGVCMLYAGGDKEKPIPFLELASRSKDVDKEVFFYLGKAYHLNYRFDNAISAYDSFKKVASRSQLQKLDVDRQVTMCNNGKSLLKNIRDLQVLDKKELSEAEFFRSYDLAGIGGKLLVKPDDFKSSIDKKKKEKSIIYVSRKNNEIFYSSYGEDEKNGRDIYVIKKQPNGQWGLPIALPSTINTPFDEDFAFPHPNGKSLYFASKGHNSMGGYDIFKSTFDGATNTWTTPENLDFAINTPDDDILYVTDSLEKTAFFSSSRLSESGMMAVFRINVARRPVDVAVINGTFAKGGGDTRLGARITVRNADNNEVVGIVNTNSTSGEYSMQLPNGGNFLFTVESEGFNSQTETVVMPKQQEFRSLRQTISYEAGTGKLVVTNYFDESAGESDYLAALNVIKEKSKLDVNSTAGPELFISPNSSALDAGGINGEIKAGKKLSNDELVRIANEDADETVKEAKELRVEADLAKSIADKRNEEAQAKSKEADGLLASAETISNPEEKESQINKAATLKKESEAMEKETVVAYNLAKKLEGEAVAKQEEADLSVKYAQDLDAAVRSSNNDALKQLEEQKNKLESLDQKPTGTAHAYQSIKKDIENKEKQISKLSEETIAIYKEIPQLEDQAKQLRADASETKKEDMKQGMLDQAGEIEADIVQMKQQAEKNDAKVRQLETETQNLQAEAELVNKLAGEIQTRSGTSPGIAVNDNTTSAGRDSAGTKPFATSADGAPAPVTIVTAVDYSEKYSNEVAKAEALSNEYDREIAKANANKEWSEAIKKDMAKKQEQLKTARTPGQKQALNVKIAQLQQQLKEKDQAVQQSTVKAGQVKQQQEFNAFSQQYIQQLNDTSAAATPSEREHIIASVNSQWAAAIDKSIEQKKQELSVTNDAKTKTAIEAEIKNLEKVSAEKKNVSKQSGAKAEQLKQREEIEKKYDYETTVNNAISNAETPANYPEAYSEELDNAEKITDEYEKEVARMIVNKKWEAAIQQELDQKSQQWASSKKKKEKEALIQHIVTLEKQLKDKQSDQQQGYVRLEDIKEERMNNASAAASGTGYVYTTAAASSAVEKSLELVKESRDLKKQAATEREDAEGISDPAEKNKKTEKAAQLEKQALEKQLEAAEISAEVNGREFTSNQSNLDELSKISAGSESDDVSIAELSKDEAQLFFTQAQQLRAEAASTTDIEKKQVLLEKANVKEADALGSQQKAKTFYSKVYPDYVFKDNTQKTSAAAEATMSATEQNTEEVVPVTNVAVNPVVKADDNQETQDTEEGSDDVSKKTDDTGDATAVPDTSSAGNNDPDQQQHNVNAGTSGFTEEKLEQIKVRKEFRDFSALRAAAEAALQDAKSQYKIAEDLRITGEQQIAKSQQLLAEADNTEDENKKQAAYQEAIALASQAKMNLTRSDSVYELAKNTEAAAGSKKNEADLILESVDEETANGMRQLVGDTPKPVLSVPEEEIKPVTILTAKDRRAEEAKRAAEQKEREEKTRREQAPDPEGKSIGGIVLAPGESFSLSNRSVYSESNPIPIDRKLPGGLIYKVQVGAFKNEIPQDAFKGISPITGETTPQGFIRYTAGIFVQYETADAIKEEIRKLGFKDAFVVAFLNGKRVPIGGAAQQVGDGVAEVAKAPPAGAGANVNAGADNTNTIAEKAVNLANTDGLVYTVQVGVYTRNAKAAKLNTIKPLLREDLPNGNIRFTTGKYSDLNLATIAKNSVVLNNGIKDAFVTVYYNGKRISFAEAKRIEGGNVAPVKPKPEPTPEPVKPVVKEPQKPVVVETPVAEIKTVTPEINDNNEYIVFPADSGVVFRVQLGAYREVPLDVANRFFKISSRGINSYRDTKGLTIYTVGATSDYEQVNRIKQEALDAGIRDAFVVAFYYGQKITVVQANTILNQ